MTAAAIEWRTIPGYLDVEMNSQGQIRKISSQTFVTVYNSAVQLRLPGGKQVSRGVRKIKVSLFPNADLEGEQWRIVNGSPWYEVSNCGRVRNATDRHIIKLQRKKGYCRAHLIDKTHMVHVLVARAFLPPAREAEQNTVNHKNGIKHDNCISNLEWASRSEQAKHAHANGLVRQSSLCRQVNQFRGQQLIATFESIADAARSTGLPTSSIGHWCRGYRQPIGEFRFTYSGDSACVITTTEQDALEWVSVEGFPMYEICREGFVRNMTSHICLSQRLIDGEYTTVTLCATGSDLKKCRPLHILLAKAFLPNPLGLPVVHHRDENKTNNALDNLQWVTHQENSEVSNAKAVYQFDMNMNIVRSWTAVNRAANDIGVSTATMSRYCQNSTIHQGFWYSYNQDHVFT